MSDFCGCFQINMDAKGRIAIPARMREELDAASEGHIVLTANSDRDRRARCVTIYPKSEWGDVKQQVERIPNSHPAVKRMQRKVLGYATPLELDSAGRILVPPTLREHAYLDKKLRLVGLGKKLEIWDEDRWHEYFDDDEDDGEIPKEMENLSI